jgi:lipopolysaccharide exporter
MLLKDTFKKILKLFKLEKIRKNSFAIDSSKVMIGTILSQAANVLSIPLLARIYSPASIGENAIFVAVMAILSTIACGRYEFAVMLPKEEEEGMAALWAAFIFCGIFSLLCVPAFGGLIALGVKGIRTDLQWAVPIGVLMSGLSNGLSFWLLRHRAFWLVSSAKLLGNIVTIAIQVTLGMMGNNTEKSLLLGMVLGYVALLLAYSQFFLKNYVGLLIETLKSGRIIPTIYRYSKFPLIDFWSATIDNFAGQVPVFILRQFFPIAQVGHYTMAMRVLTIPIGLISASISQVFFQRAAEMHGQGKNISVFTNQIYRKIIYLGLPPLLFISIFGEWLFSILLGNQWAAAGKLAQVMAPALFFALLFNPLSSVVIILERQQIALISRILMLMVAVIPLLISINFYPQQILFVIMSLSISQGALYFILSQWNLQMTKIVNA